MTDLSYFEFNILIYLELVKIDKNGTKGPKEKKGEGRSWIHACTEYKFKYSTNTWKGQIQIRKLQFKIPMRWQFPMLKHEKN